MQNELTGPGYERKGMSNRGGGGNSVTSFLMRKVHSALHVKTITCLRHAGVALVGNRKKPVGKDFCGSGG